MGLRILCDVDGVIANFIGAVCAFDGKAKPEDFTKFDLISGLKDPDREKAVLDAVESQFFCSTIEPYPAAHDFINELHLFAGSGELIFLTSPHDSKYWHNERVEWLKNHFGVLHNEIIFADTDQKKYIHADILIEDRYQTAYDWWMHRERHSSMSYVLGRPWNREFLHNRFPGVFPSYTSLLKEIEDNWL